MLRFTLLKVGRKRTTDYRIVVREKRSSPRSQKYIESVGSYNTKTKKLALHRERVSYWLSQGVQPSGTVHNMFVNEKIISGPKMAVTPRTHPQTDSASTSVASSGPSGSPQVALPQSADAGATMATPAATQKETAPSFESSEAIQEPNKKAETEESKSA